ncbi:hypothetical protein ACQP1G_29735 [Nocardia sp. CA-107356]|uniref:hypothetical protein n=1 Tax=Nocardia sp. CA-107356 TaxID=3239972 RepID=UPI003D8F54AF
MTLDPHILQLAKHWLISAESAFIQVRAHNKLNPHESFSETAQRLLKQPPPALQ